jgi:hypothetical protein
MLNTTHANLAIFHDVMSQEKPSPYLEDIFLCPAYRGGACSDLKQSGEFTGCSR